MQHIILLPKGQTTVINKQVLHTILYALIMQQLRENKVNKLHKNA